MLLIAFSLLTIAFRQVHIVLPPLTALLHTTTQMGKISSTIHVSVNRNGHLSLRAESDLANVQTDWRDLEQPDISTHDAAGDDGGDDGAEAEAESQQVDKMAFESVALDQKSFVKFLSSHVIANTTIACGSHVRSAHRAACGGLFRADAFDRMHRHSYLQELCMHLLRLHWRGSSWRWCPDVSQHPCIGFLTRNTDHRAHTGTSFQP